MTRLSPGAGNLTAAAAIAWAMTVLREAGVEGAARDARILVSAATGLERLEFLNRPDAVLSGAQKTALEDVVNRRFQREPVSRILGRRAFYGREFDISPHTLDPRQDSETLIDAALQLLEEDGVSRNEPLRIIDVGTGSGCLLITLLAELPNATGVGTDIEPGALRQAKLNASANGVASRADWSLARSLEGIDETFDLLISNPPYIPTGDIQGLDREVRDYDPRSALDGGKDGLDVYREIANQLSTVVSRGWSIFEVGAGQANSVNEILAAADAPLIRVFRDLDGVDRCVARKARI